MLTKKTGYLDDFTNISSSKEKSKIDYDDLIACILGNGTNYGLYKMANISDRSVGKLRSVEESYLRAETIGFSNDHISDAIAALPIFSYYHIEINSFTKVLMDKNLNVESILSKRVTLQNIYLKEKVFQRLHLYQIICR